MPGINLRLMAKKKRKKKQQKKKKFKNIKQIANEFADENRRMATPAAKHFKKLLTLSGFRFKSEKIVYKEVSFYIVDFYIPDRNLCIELDGGYHNTPEQKAKDIERDRFMESKGYHNWRMTNEEALALTRDELVAKIKSFIPKERNIRVLAYQEPRMPLLKPKKLKGNPPASRRRTKLKRKPTRPNLPTPAEIAENKARRESLNRKAA